MFAVPVPDFREGLPEQSEELKAKLTSAYLKFKHKLISEAFDESDGFYDIVQCPHPLYRTEEWLRGRIAQIQYDIGSYEAEQICQMIQGKIRKVIDDYAVSVGYPIPLAWVP